MLDIIEEQAFDFVQNGTWSKQQFMDYMRAKTKEAYDDGFENGFQSGGGNDHD